VSQPPLRPIRRRPRPSPVGRVVLAVAIIGQCIVLYLPRAPAVGGGWGLDKVVHAAIFAAVTLAALRCWYRAPGVVFLGVAHACVSELIQANFLPGRSGDVSDVVADLAGIAGVIIWRAVLGPDPRTAADKRRRPDLR
jgi:hypothetical protein